VKQVLVQNGSVAVKEVPAPSAGPKNLLVEVMFSCVSVGTEMAGIRMSGLPLYRRALKQPEHVKKIFDVMRDQGIKRTYDRITGKLNAGVPTGYSAAGRVIAIGEKVEAFKVGEFVACAGSGIANHAEYIDVPVNLAVRLREGTDLRVASTVTLGAIALQGVRRANPTMGEKFVVIGLGILGQITAQLLKANGCLVVGTDVDPRRVTTALENGMDFGAAPSQEDFIGYVHRLTDGFGADAVIVTAATSSDEVISQAFAACRKKGRVVLVGDVGLDLKRSDFYKKEIDFLISSSYGPGRYDPVYEEGGQDYPLPFVRWTENRNMEAYLDLVNAGRINLHMQSTDYPVERATEAFESLKAPGPKPLLVFLTYPEHAEAASRRVTLSAKPAANNKIVVGLAGAGNFATAMHLPNMVKQRDKFELHGVMSRTGSNANAVGVQFSAAYATTEFEELLNDAAVNLVLIATRHDLHGGMVLQALHAGKNVFVEKPLTIHEGDLAQIERFYATEQNPPLLMVGFNRRFSPAVQNIRAALVKRTTPLIVNYRMNAGFIPPEHWVHTAEGGGRNLGEACHIYDVFAALTGSSPALVQASAISPTRTQWRKNDNFVATITYKDGSVCTLTYTALGSKAYPKERMDVFTDGKVFTLDDYKSMTIAGAKTKGWNSMTMEKGQFQELEALADCILNGTCWPISLEQQLETTRVAFEVERQIMQQNGGGAGN